MKEIHMRIIKPVKKVRLTILLTVIASSIVAISSGATIPAFAQQAPIDLEKFDLQEIPEIDIPEIPEDEEEDVIPCLPPPECLLPGAEVCIQVCWPFSEE
jgi:hypothetical protein